MTARHRDDGLGFCSDLRVLAAGVDGGRRWKVTWSMGGNAGCRLRGEKMRMAPNGTF